MDHKNSCGYFYKPLQAKKVIQPLVGDRKAEQAIRRLCHRNPRTGKRKVSSSVAKQFMRGGKSRADLIALFIKNGGNKETQFQTSV